ncbi:MAG: ParB N-terminal domain-containing protein [Clostridia bacterium]|nr:ParB N-terminal domain-containing protein [Clostridia bacterium]
MAVGTGSLKRAAGVKAKAKSEVVLLKDNGVVELEISSLEYKKEKNNSKMLSSVKAYGVIMPVIAVKKGDKFEVVDGNKRVNALKELGATTVKAVVVGDATEISRELALFKPVTSSDDIHEQKFNVIKRLGEDDLPFYLL